MRFDASVLPDVTGVTVGILGGTGDQGRGLAYRLARAGQPVRIGLLPDIHVSVRDSCSLQHPG